MGGIYGMYYYEGTIRVNMRVTLRVTIGELWRGVTMKVNY